MIGISLLTLNREAAGGTLTYARELIQALDRVSELDYRVFVPSTAQDAADGLPAAVTRALPGGRTRVGRVAALAISTLTPPPLQRTLKARGLRAVHFPLTVMLPRPGTTPAAATIHDLQHETFPEFFSRAQLAYRRRAYRWSVEHSRIVITDSEHVRREVIDRYGLDPAHVRTIHLGVDLALFAPDGRDREQFLLYPANFWPHKNHERLFDAFSRVLRARPDLRLVLTGADHGRRPLPPGVESLGHVPVDRLVELYRRAAALVYPSLYEGFGIPCLEAMACGCPVAAARVTSLPEVCGDAAVYFDPFSVDDIVRAIEDVLTEPPPGGIERAADFTWDRCALSHDALYRELADAGA